MNTTSVHIKIDTAIKNQAQATAGELGISLTTVIKALLTQFVRQKRLSIGLDEIPNTRTRAGLAQSDKEIAEGKTIKFANDKEMFAYLDKEIADEKHTTSSY